MSSKWASVAPCKPVLSLASDELSPMAGACGFGQSVYPFLSAAPPFQNAQKLMPSASIRTGATEADLKVVSVTGKVPAVRRPDGPLGAYPRATPQHPITPRRRP